MIPPSSTQFSYQKILDMAELSAVCEQAKQAGLIVGHCHGCFDLLHAGHIRHFEAARKLCDLLVVTVTSDKFVGKGPKRPVMSEQDRATILGGMAAVCHVAISDAENAQFALSQVCPDIYFKGQDYVEAIHQNDTPVYAERVFVEKLGGRCVITNEPRDSSTSIIDRIKAL